MKKLLAIALVIVTMTTLLTGCIGTFDCEICGENQFGIKYEKKIDDEKITYCGDCKEIAKNAERIHCDLCNTELIGVKYSHVTYNVELTFCADCKVYVDQLLK